MPRGGRVEIHVDGVKLHRLGEEHRGLGPIARAAAIPARIGTASAGDQAIALRSIGLPSRSHPGSGFCPDSHNAWICAIRSRTSVNAAATGLLFIVVLESQFPPDSPGGALALHEAGVGGAS
jgi:hypothetical protein